MLLLELLDEIVINLYYTLLVVFEVFHNIIVDILYILLTLGNWKYSTNSFNKLGVAVRSNYNRRGDIELVGSLFNILNELAKPFVSLVVEYSVKD